MSDAFTQGAADNDAKASPATARAAARRLRAEAKQLPAPDASSLAGDGRERLRTVLSENRSDEKDEGGTTAA